MPGLAHEHSTGSETLLTQDKPRVQKTHAPISLRPQPVSTSPLRSVISLASKQLSTEQRKQTYLGM